MTPQELEDLALRHLPENFLRKTLKAVFAAHAVSWAEAKGSFARTEALNVQPYMKRATLEGYLRDVAEQFEGIDATATRSSETGWWYHTELRSGPVILTESSVSRPCGPVDKAEFRVTLAKSNWLTLFPDERQTADAPLYALLLHSKSRWPTAQDRRDFEHLPGSAYLAFPASDLSTYLHEINLFDRFPDIVDEHLPREWDGTVRLRYFAGARRTAA
ncbi:MAG: hypothetical protein QOJ13_811 [Gaiellales bacterium]|jgi:hypothetical protein|nr:hypothetical protein [Gaiellales bacterium]